MDPPLKLHVYIKTNGICVNSDPDVGQVLPYVKKYITVHHKVYKSGTKLSIKPLLYIGLP